MSALRQVAARSLWWVGLESAGVSGLSLVTVVLLARLLAPADFGVAALVLGLVQLLGVVVEMLFHDAIVQRPGLEDDHVDTAFWTSLGLGVLSAATCVAIAGWFGRQFGEPTLAPLLRWAALGLVFAGMNAVQIPIMRRNLQFKSLAMRTVFGRALGLVVGVTLALRGYGPWAIVGQYLVSNGVAMLVIWSRAPRWPALRYSPSHARQLMAFAVPSVSGHLLFIGNLRIFTMMTGYLLGATAVGYLSLGFRVFDVLRDVLGTAINTLALSLLSRRQADRGALERAYHRGTELTCLIALPICAGVLACAHEIVLMVFGAPWLPTVPVLQLLAVTTMVGFMRQMTPITLNAVGRPHDNLVASLIGFVVSVAALVVFGPLGVLGAALAWSMRSIVPLPVGIRQLRRATGMAPATQFAGAAVPSAAALVMIAGLYVAQQHVTAAWAPPAALALLIPLGAATYLLAVGAMSRRLLVQLADLLVDGLRPGGRAVPAGRPAASVGEGPC